MLFTISSTIPSVIPFTITSVTLFIITPTMFVIAHHTHHRAYPRFVRTTRDLCGLNLSGPMIFPRKVAHNG
jgi:hypothetical protein